MSKHLIPNTLAFALFVALASAATAAERPLPSPPGHFAWAPTGTAPSVSADAEFWRTFNDPQLSALVERALQENHDLRIALARFDGANALLRHAKFDRWPTVTAQATATDGHLSASQAPGVAYDDRDGESHSAGASLSWELDLFGRVRHGVNARRAEAGAAARDVQAMQVSIVAEVVRSYVELRGLQERLRVAQENEASQAQTLRLVVAGVDAGRGTAFDSSRASSQLAATRARIPSLEAGIATTLHRLAVLTGQVPEALLSDFAAPQALPDLPPGLDPGTPGDLLLRRPDVAAAEARLEASGERVGVAKADRFPRFTLGGLIGGQSVDAGSLFNRDGESRLVVLGIDWSFLDFGRVHARIAAAQAEGRGEQARYEQVVLQALEETENALVGYGQARTEDEQLTLAARESAEAVRLARLRYEAGAIDLFEVLDAQRTHLVAQDAAVQGRTRSYENLVLLYKAMAGGWPNRLPQPGIAERNKSIATDAAPTKS
jgi:NodT family efflux transporter outer membrane factor (OMF) lipoprotein